MIIDLDKPQGKLNFSKLIFSRYDYVVIGTGPSGTVLIDTLLKRKKKY